MLRSCMLLVLALALPLFAVGCKNDKTAENASPAPQARTSPDAPPATPSASTLDRVQQSKVLRIGVKSDNPPFCFQDKDGNPQGFDVDLGFRLSRALGVQPVFVTVTSAERISAIKDGKVDVVIATLTATRRRAREIDFSLPYYEDQQKLLVRAASPVQSYRDLSGKKVSAAKGSTSIDNIKVVAPDAQIVEAGSVAEAFGKLQAGDVEAITGDGLTLQALQLSASDPKQFRFAGEGFSVEPYVVGLPQNDSLFRARVNEALTEVWTSGVWTRIFNKWLGPQTPYNLEARFQMPVLPP